ESASMSHQRSKPSAAIDGPPMPRASSPPSASASAASTPAASRSPDFSPATAPSASPDRAMVLPHDAPCHPAEELQQQGEVGGRLVARRLSLGGQLGARLLQAQAALVQRLVRATQLLDALAIEAAPTQALAVESMGVGRRAGGHDIGRQVVQDHGPDGGHGMRADLAELVDAGVAAEDHPVAQHDMAGQVG